MTELNTPEDREKVPQVRATINISMGGILEGTQPPAEDEETDDGR